MKFKILISIVVVLAVGFQSTGYSQGRLPIPPLYEGKMQNGKRTFNLLMQHSSTEFFQEYKRLPPDIMAVFWVQLSACEKVMRLY